MHTPEPELTEHHLSVARTARYHMLGRPSELVRELWFVLHGYGHLAADFLGDFACIQERGRLIVAPEGLSRFYLRGSRGRIGASWMTREDRVEEIADTNGYLDELHRSLTTQLDRDVALHVFGFSQGGSAAFRWAMLGRQAVQRLTLWASAVPPDLDLEHVRERLETAQLTLIVGRDDEYVSERRLAEAEERLKQHGIRYTLRRFEGNHRLDEPLLRELAARA